MEAAPTSRTSRGLAAALLVCGTCAVGASACWDFDYIEGPGAADATADARPTPTTAPDGRVACVEGGYYCGGERVTGDPRSLHRCNKDGTGTLTTTCATSCIVAAPGKDDACSAPPNCVVNGTYCGGDKVNGDPDVLYRCNSGNTISVVRRCPSGCQINKNDDDTCK